MITYQDYFESCKRFSKETKDWAALDDYQYYTTHEIDGWKESCDNAHGGLNVGWAFHKSDEEIERCAPMVFREVDPSVTPSLVFSWDNALEGCTLEGFMLED